MKAPSRSLVCEWVKSSWDAVSTEMVLGSFIASSLGSPVNWEEVC